MRSDALAKVALCVRRLVLGPRSLLTLPSTDVQFSEYKRGGQSYTIANVNYGQIFTDTTCNISVISHQRLIPLVSWQYHYGEVLDDHLNFYLDGTLKTGAPLAFIKGTVLSLLTGGSGNYNYYHWLFDVLPRLFLVQKVLDLRDPHIKYFVPSLRYPFQRQTLAALGISMEQCIESVTTNHLKAKTLLAVSHPNPEPHDNQCWIVEELRARFLGHQAEIPNSSFIYITRSDAVHRRLLVNEQELLESLKPLGFHVYCLSALSFAEQIHLFSQAKIIVGVHGAGMANLAFATAGACVFELFSELYQPDMYEKLSICLNVEYHKIVCQAAKSPDAQTANIFVSEQQLQFICKRALELSIFSRHSQ